ncbi:DUF349 domain-containing protein [Marinobacter caseinilyticus]|uniref:DUF349 domain-containing protein n=1 Tax=Marinobacter caseinilyticus TaxID=2692195 RepID=UPI00140983A7|nr:DUF349 domain-containing protein [Marinobacter caseinilyticus]
MAAFIQKFFKGRKTPEKSTQPAPAPEQVQQDQVAEQQRLLKDSPTTEQLEHLAVEGKTADLRLEAAQAIDDHETLLRLQKASRGRDKGVYQAVRQRLQEAKNIEAEKQRQFDSVQSAIRQAEDHAKTENMQLYSARFENLLKQWNAVENFASADQTALFLNAAHQCRSRLRQIEELQQAEQVHASKADERAQTLSVLETTLNDLKVHPEDRLPSLSALDALQKTQENRWLEATRDTDVGKSQQKSYESLMQALRGFIATVQRLQQHSTAISEALASTSDEVVSTPERVQILTLIDEIEWPDGYAQPAELSQLVAMAGKAAPKPKAESVSNHQDDEKAALKTTLDNLEATLEARQLKESRHFFKLAQQQLQGLDHRNGRGLQARMQLLNGQLRELQDWQGFATQPKQIALCERMEYLADQHMEPEAKASKIKELQTEWRELGGSSDRELWQRFKKASDLAYEPCKEYFSAKSGLKKVNLQKRQDICDQLALFVAQTDWATADWKAVEQIDRVAKDEWKAAWPVEFRDNRVIQKRFDQLLSQLEHPLNSERERNETLKSAIVEQAEALIEHEPLSDAMNQAKHLQTEWKAVGITRHRQDRKLWQAFRAACDQVFARRDAQKHEQAAQVQEAGIKLDALLDQSEEIADSVDQGTLNKALNELSAMKSEPMSSPMKDRLNAELKRIRGLQKQQQQAQTIALWQQRIQERTDGIIEPGDCPEGWEPKMASLPSMTPRELVIRAEILTTQPSPEEDQSLRMEIQVKRLADGMAGNTERDALDDQLEALIAAWCLATLDGDRTNDLATRLSAALAASVA